MIRGDDYFIFVELLENEHRNTASGLANRRVRLPKKSHLDEFLTFDPLGHIKMIGVILRVNCNRVIKL